jgi:fermentation-respiration switch protein FrsA (DUF1100 family)
MPWPSIWFIRASLVYLLIGFTLGASILAQDGVSYYPAIYEALPAHMEFLLVGWLVQLAMGVAFWMFPRFGWELPNSRGNPVLMWVSFALLNAGIWAVALSLWLSYGLLIGRVLEIGAVSLFVIGLWRRVKPHGANS